MEVYFEQKKVMLYKYIYIYKCYINHGLVAIIVLLNFSSKLCFLTFSHQDSRFISKHGSEKCSWRFNLFFGVENYPAFLHVCQPINQTRQRNVALQPSVNLLPTTYTDIIYQTKSQHVCIVCIHYRDCMQPHISKLCKTHKNKPIKRYNLVSLL